MQKTRLFSTKLLACLVPTLVFMQLHAVTIDDMASRNNKIIELDQEIAIAEKNKKLAELKGGFLPNDTIALPKLGTAHHEDPMAVISVHGAPGNPVVDVQYGDMLLQRRRGETLPNGWEIAEIGAHSVTVVKATNKGRAPLMKKIPIGQLLYPTSSDSLLIASPVAAEIRTGRQ